MKKAMVLGAIILVTGCEVPKTPVPTGGSRSDALVELSYQVAALEVPKVDWDAAQVAATKRCNAWGYRRADAFEGTKNQCQSFDMYGCNLMNVTRVYQCTN